MKMNNLKLFLPFVSPNTYKVSYVKFSALIITFLAFTTQTNAQIEKQYLRKGNKKYNDKNYEEAQVNYRKALNENGNSYESNFNLGDALYQQGDFNGAAQKFETAASVAKNKTDKAKALHNMGNAFLKADRLTQAIDAYKQALRNNPDDKETKYNLSYALKKQKQQEEQNKQQQQQQKDKQNKEDKQDNKDKKEQEQDKEGKNKEKEQEKQGKDKEKQEQDKQNGEAEKPGEDEKNNGQENQPQEGKMSDAEAERILDAIKSEEQKVQQRIFQRNKDQQKKERTKGKQW